MSSELKPEQVVQALERRILSGELRAGERLPTEGELGAELGVSRTVVRDAVRTLTTRRLVRVRHGFGMEVAVPSHLPIAHALADYLMRSDATVGDVLDAREALDSHLAPLAARNATEEDAARMAADFERFAAASAGGDAAVAQDAHLEIHLGFVRAMHLPALELMLKPMAEVILLSSVRPAPDPARWEVESHRPLVEALGARDERALVEAVEHHFSVLRGGAYDDFRRNRFCELLDHREFALLRGLLTSRAAAAEAGL
jgi:GntR family transcriptional regulator, transcriptional repressor for pyruvate dehydrogenase complex